MSLMRILRNVVLSLVAVLLIGGLLAAWFLGPSLGIALRGAPFFLFPPSPERYATVVLDEAESRGLYADDPAFADARAEAERVAEQAGDVAETHETLHAALQIAGGTHSHLIPPGQVAAAEAAVPAEPTVTRDESVVVATVPAHNQAHDPQAYADTLARGLTDGDDVCGAVVDLRGNTGGDMGPMVAGLSPLLPDGVALRFVAGENSSPVVVEGNSVRGGGTPVTTSGGKLGVPVAVLTDELTASSGEATLVAFHGLDDVRTFGTPTAGYASANMTFTMPDGALILLTAMQFEDRTGHVHEEAPIEPDGATDDPEQQARDWLREEHGCS